MEELSHRQWRSVARLSPSLRPSVSADLPMRLGMLMPQGSSSGVSAMVGGMLWSSRKPKPRRATVRAGLRAPCAVLRVLRVIRLQDSDHAFCNLRSKEGFS